MKWDLPFTCTKCQQPFQAKSWKSVDVVENPELRKLIMSEEFNLNFCPQCKHPARIHAPFILWEDSFIAIVLQQPFQAQDAMSLIQRFLTSTKPNRENSPTDVLVFATLEKLQKALANAELTRIIIPLEQLAHRDWFPVKIPLQEIGDALLQHDMPERAFFIYRQVIQQIPELYFHQDLRENFELLAHAAGSRLAPEQTALEQLKEIHERLAPHAPRIPSFTPYRVGYCPIDETGETGEGLQAGDEHVVTANKTFIKSDRVAKDELVRGLLLVRSFASLALQWLPSPQPGLERFAKLSKLLIDSHWFDLDPHTRSEIGVWFEESTGARINEE